MSSSGKIIRVILCFCATFVLPVFSADDDSLPVLEQGTAAPVVPGKIIRYASALMQRFNKHGGEVLEQSEWDGLIPTPQAADIDGDRKITLEELVRYLALFGKDKTIHHPQVTAVNEERKVDPANMKLFRSVIPQPAAETKTDAAAEKSAEDVSDKALAENDKPIDDAVYEEIMRSNSAPAVKRYHTAPETLRGVPAWFLIRDLNGDGQISLSEFAPTLSAASLALFGKLDKNGNGFIEPDEVRSNSP
jgi:Ca2+-binding EF-hand superfamily protein